jgi:hypothetical protein
LGFSIFNRCFICNGVGQERIRMSHFTVLVAAKDEKDLERVLLPFHEYECTGLLDYTERIPIDVGELQADYNKYARKDEKTGHMPTLDEFAQGWHGLDEDRDRGPDGRWYDLSNHRFYAWYNAQGRLLFYAYEFEELPGAEHPSSTEIINEKEYAQVNHHVLNVTDKKLLFEFLTYLAIATPNTPQEQFDRKRGIVGPLVRRFIKGRKWDWYIVGGRWSGELLLKEGGEGTTNTNISNLVEPNKNPNRADTALAGDIDFEGMRQNYIDQVSSGYDKWKALPPADQKEERSAAIHSSDLWWFECERADDIDGGMSKEDYIAKYAQAHALTFAFITPDGQWIERGNMGWWAAVSNKNPNYDKLWWDFVTTLPADQRVYLVDCHI